MRLSLSMWSLQEEVYAGRMGLNDFLNLCQQNDVATVELLEFFKTDSLLGIRKAAEDRGIAIGAWSAANNFVQADKSAIQGQIDEMKRSIDGAVQLGTTVLRVFSGDENPDVAYDNGVAMIVDAFQACIPHARQAGVVMALENHGVFAGRSDQVNAVIHSVDSPFLKATVDTANFLFVDEDPLTAVGNIANNAAWVHFKDYRKSTPDEPGSWPSLLGVDYVGTALGDGCVPLQAIAQRLQLAGYAGCLSIEFEGPDPIQSTIKSIAAVKKILSKLS